MQNKLSANSAIKNLKTLEIIDSNAVFLPPSLTSLTTRGTTHIHFTPDSSFFNLNTLSLDVQFLPLDLLPQLTKLMTLKGNIKPFLNGCRAFSSAVQQNLTLLRSIDVTLYNGEKFKVEEIKGMSGVGRRLRIQH